MSKQFKTQIKDLFNCFKAILYVARKGELNSKMRIQNISQARGLTILANGPSLMKDLDKALGRLEQDYAGLNYFGCTDLFLQVRPRYYFMMDRAFFSDTERNTRRADIKSMYERFNQFVDWKMTIIVPCHFVESFINFSKLTNSNIDVIGVNTNGLETITNIRHKFYRRNWGLPRPQNVTILAIYCGINLGYKDIYLYGVDHTFIQDICVDEENRLCLKWEHFYDKKAKLKPVVDTLGTPHSIASELLTVAITFRSHELIREYADEMGCRIVNCTYGSMIDSYIRESQLFNQKQ